MSVCVRTLDIRSILFIVLTGSLFSLSKNIGDFPYIDFRLLISFSLTNHPTDQPFVSTKWELFFFFSPCLSYSGSCRLLSTFLLPGLSSEHLRSSFLLAVVERGTCKTGGQLLEENPAIRRESCVHINCIVRSVCVVCAYEKRQNKKRLGRPTVIDVQSKAGGARLPYARRTILRSGEPMWVGI